MDDRTESVSVSILYVVMVAAIVAVVLGNMPYPWGVSVCAGILLLTVTVRKAVLYESEQYRAVGFALILLDLPVIGMLNYLDRGGAAQLFYFILIGETAIACPPRYSRGVGIAAFLLYAADLYWFRESGPAGTVWADLAFGVLAFSLTMAFLYILRIQFGQRETLMRALFDLKVTSKKLEDANIRLKEASEQIQELTVLEERNRMAREIHDTVGHTLTTVLMGLEAGERLIPTDPAGAVEKIRLAKRQIRTGLNDVRSSVRMLRGSTERMGLVSSLQQLARETERQACVTVRMDIGPLPCLGAVKEQALYRAVQEGLTNGIRHGGGTAFLVQLCTRQDEVQLLVQDNGTGADPSELQPGFGLSSMEERVELLGGRMTIESSKDEGFLLRIILPIGMEASL
ncbi:MAG: integral rane sensor signal transduction histidine kinase [Paenibacillaceae bacterium]|jgi:signal transduction histidine kinase|nr:integral rane sensor signal transduction histidine kinase [Paenibacillaceae bacterium]